MSWNDNWNNAKAVFKSGTTKQRIAYIWGYYKLHIFILLFIVYFISSIIYSNVSAKDTVLYGLFLNTLSEPEVTEALKTDFLEKQSIDTSSEDIVLDSSLHYLPGADSANSIVSYETAQVVISKVASQEIDFMISTDSALMDFAYDEYFCDLSEVLSDEQMKTYEPYFLYYDKAVVEELKGIDYTAETIPVIVFPDPTRPDLMECPVPIMINVASSGYISKLYPNSTQIISMGFVANGKNTENAIRFLELLM